MARAEEATEDPTPRRLAEARRRGEVAFSRELGAAAALAAAVAVLAADAPAALARWMEAMRGALGAAVAGTAGGASLGWAGASLALRMLAPPLGAAMIVALLLGLVQTRGLVLAPVRFDLRRLADWRRLFGPRAAVAAGLSLLKVALIGALAWLTLRPVLGSVVALVGAAPGRLLQVMGVLTQRLAVRLALAGLAFGVVDLLLVVRRHRRGLRMTREEVKRDYKEAEGDPAHRGERQRLHRELLEQRMVEEVRKADFVVVNPDHIAVALRYDPEGDAAPVVVAKGERLVAERIKQIAREAGVPIFRDVGLARSLAELAEGGEIPAALYEAVAEILRVVQGLEHEAAPAAPQAEAVASIGPGADWKRV
jgi:flagellar biosynthesis protein FlhB